MVKFRLRLHVKSDYFDTEIDVRDSMLVWLATARAGSRQDHQHDGPS
jgi:hypothetical protein